MTDGTCPTFAKTISAEKKVHCHVSLLNGRVFDYILETAFFSDLLALTNAMHENLDVFHVGFSQMRQLESPRIESEMVMDFFRFKDLG